MRNFLSSAAEPGEISGSNINQSQKLLKLQRYYTWKLEWTVRIEGDKFHAIHVVAGSIDCIVLANDHSKLGACS